MTEPTSVKGPGTAPPDPIRIPGLGLRRVVFFGLVSVTTLFGGWMMLGIVGDGGVSALEALILALFVPTFGWITIPFWTSLLGFGLRLFRIDPLTLRSARERAHTADQGGPVLTRTAVVMPAYNEDPERLLRRFGATMASVAATAHGDRFDFFLLSDTTDPATAAEEEAAWSRFAARARVSGSLTYRRRADNVSKKAGNIRDFCERWGDEYELMVVLDADSTMRGDTLVALVRAMERNPGAGLIQTTPLPAGQETLFGRLLQLGGRLLAPVLSAGQSFWQGDTGNYWGHNAIVRMQPFRELTRLPTLPGEPPLGGEILSHDFVEAALLRKGGWSVLFLSDLDGSYEDVPPTLPEYAKRDRRWAQGSLQHLRLLASPGLHPLSRFHLFAGAMGYLSSVLWFFLLAAGTTYVVGSELGWDVSGGGSATSAVTSGPMSFSLLGLTAIILFLPKLLGLGLAAIRHADRFGGVIPLCQGAAIELLFGIALAPILMIHHLQAVFGILRGRTSGWVGGRRDAGDAPWSEAWREGRAAMIVGVVWALVTASVSLQFLLWLSPILTGLLFAVPLVRWTASRELGEVAQKAGLLRVGEDPGITIDPSPARDETEATPVQSAVNW